MHQQHTILQKKLENISIETFFKYFLFTSKVLMCQKRIIGK